ncbi:MAG: hypothetical protein EXS13_09450 [Planctomycetes bacterium]|nr:hypothetical protein [Planctomycetota bacterium]
MRNDPLPALERALADALAMVRELHAQGALPPVLEALTLIAPPRGFVAQPELKPFTDHARPDEWSRESVWDPRNGTVQLYFEPANESHAPRAPERSHQGDRGDRSNQGDRGWRQAPVAPPPPALALPSTEQAQHDLIAVVARAESDSAFKFLALKYLRDQLLPRHVAWGVLQSEGQIQINRAIEAGMLVTGKVENPRMPQYPVTTVTLNREHPAVQAQLAAIAGGAGGNGTNAAAVAATPTASDRDAADSAIEDEPT